MRRAWRRVIPTARSIPSSRVRSWTASTSVLTMPNTLITTERASRTYSMLRTMEMSSVVMSANSPRSITFVSGKSARAASMAGSPAPATNV